MTHPKAIGDRTTLVVMLALRVAGYDVAVPFGENTRYDLVIDDGNRLSRVQCKTGRIRDGAVTFKTCSSHPHHARPRLQSNNYAGQVEFFAVHCPPTAGVYLIPIGDVATKWEARLRLDPAKNSQRVRIR